MGASSQGNCEGEGEAEGVVMERCESIGSQGALADEPETEKAHMVYFLKYLLLFYIALGYLVKFDL